MQSHAGAVHLLPALPDRWTEGSVEGLRCRGGFVLERLTWRDGRLEEAVIRSTKGGALRLRSAVPIEGLEAADPACVTENPLLRPQTLPATEVSAEAPAADFELPAWFEYEIGTKAGGRYTFRAAAR